MRSKTKLSVAVAALAMAVAIAAPAANARISPPTPAVTCDPSAVPPPPSSIAVSAAKEYAILRACADQDESSTVASAPNAPRQDLRSPDARDAAEGRYLGMSRPRQDLRSPDTRDTASPHVATVRDSPAVEPAGFDWASAALGAVAGTGLMLLALALAGPARRRPSHARNG